MKKFLNIKTLIEASSDNLSALLKRAGVKPEKKQKKKKAPTQAQAPDTIKNPSVAKADQDSFADLVNKAKDVAPKDKKPSMDILPGAPLPSVPEPTKEPRGRKATPNMGNPVPAPHWDPDIPRITPGNAVHPPGRFHAFDHHSDRLDAAYDHPHDHFNDFLKRINDPHSKVSFKSVRSALTGEQIPGQQNDRPIGGINDSYRGKIHTPGQQDMAWFGKPLHTINPNMNSERLNHAIGARQEATYRLMAHMGMSHMGLAGKTLTMPTNAHDSVSEDDYWDHGHILGKSAMLTRGITAMPLDKFTTDKLKLDPEEVKHAAIMHLLTGHRDGHRQNVLIRHNGYNHTPVIMDWDLAMHPHERVLGWDTNRFRSVFAPKGKLDYTKFVGNIGKNYPPRVAATLNWLANGGHADSSHGLGLDNHDTKYLANRARAMLDNGFEKVLNSHARIMSE